MLVDAQVSSMNTSRSGSRSSWPSNHSSRRFRMSGRSCSLAWPVFFARDPVPGEEAPQGGDADAHAPRGQHLAQLRQRRVWLLLDRVQNKGRMLLDLHRATISALRLGGRRAVLERQLPPPDRARRADAEPLGRPPARHTIFNGSDHTVPKITRQGSTHPCRPPPPARIVNQKTASV
jgi:hypothetical protein